MYFKLKDDIKLLWNCWSFDHSRFFDFFRLN
jgi:hypothetical protein